MEICCFRYTPFKKKSVIKAIKASLLLSTLLVSEI